MITVEQIPGIYTAYRARYSDRDTRIDVIDKVVAGDLTVLDPDEDKIESRSPNLVQVALEDTAEAAGQMPTVRVVPRRSNVTGKRVAGRMEKIATGYFDFAQMELLVPQTIMDMAAFGFACWVIWPDFDERLPSIEKRDPRLCYPEPGFRPGQPANRVMFARQVFYDQLPADYQDKLVDFRPDALGGTQERWSITLVEFYDAEEIVIAGLFESQGHAYQQGPGALTPVILERIENRTGVCQVVVMPRFALDGEFRGQFDQIVGVLLAHVRLMGMVLDYADQAVYSDIWVKDLIGELSWGGGAYIELGPQGAIGRVPPAVTSLNVQQDLDRLVDFMHIGGRWPKSRPGEIDQSIASAKFIEAAAGMMNTTIKCMAPQTRVLTEALEYVPVGELAVGDKLLGFDEYPTAPGNRNWRTTEVLRVGRAMLDSYRVTLEDGTSIVCSAEHKWLTGSGSKRDWRTTEDLTLPTRHPHRVVKLLDVWEQEKSWEAGYLAGMFDGEGCISMSGKGLQLGLDQKDNVALHQVKLALKERGFTFATYLKPNDCYHLNILGGRSEILRLLGTIRPQRLIDRFIAAGGGDVMGNIHALDLVQIRSIEHVGLTEVVTLSTSTETLVAEGFAHHNTYHQLLKRGMEHALRLCFITDQKYFPGQKMVSGILRNQEFVEEYDATADIDVRSKIRVEYGLGLGRDPAQSAVLMLQYAQNEYISHEFVQENIDGLTDVARERVRIDTQKFRSMLLADLLQGLQGGTIPKEALVDIIDARERGEDLAEIYRKYIVEPAQAPQEPGLGAPLGAPGGPSLPPAPGGLPPGGPPGGPGALTPPPAPAPSELIARLGVPAGNKQSFLGSTVGG